MNPQKLADEAVEKGSVEIPEDMLFAVDTHLAQRYRIIPVVEDLGGRFRVYARNAPAEAVADHIEREFKFFYPAKSSGISLRVKPEGEGESRRWMIRAEGPDGILGDAYPSPEGVPDAEFEGVLRGIRLPEFVKFAAHSRGALAKRLLPEVNAKIDAGNNVATHMKQAHELAVLIESDQIARIQEHVNRAAETYPDLGLSFGYIGNLERWGDDRLWMVFTKAEHGGASTDKFGRVSTAQIGGLLEMIERGDLERWCADLRQRRAQPERGRTRTL